MDSFLSLLYRENEQSYQKRSNQAVLCDRMSEQQQHERKMKDVECQTTMVDTNTFDRHHPLQNNRRCSYGHIFAFGSACALFVFCFVSLRQTMITENRLQQQDILSSFSLSVFRRPSPLTWHINPIKPLHHGKAVFLTQQSDTDGQVLYKRIFTAPCAYGM
jgi:hypothetical protein